MLLSWCWTARCASGQELLFIMQKLKQKLLDTGDFKDCEALTKYCKLVEANQDTTLAAGQTQSHHILPRA